MNFVENLSDNVCENKNLDFVLGRRNEGFKMASQVQYVARVGNFTNKDLMRRLQIISNSSSDTQRGIKISRSDEHIISTLKKSL